MQTSIRRMGFLSTVTTTTAEAIKLKTSNASTEFQRQVLKSIKRKMLECSVEKMNIDFEEGKDKMTTEVMSELVNTVDELEQKLN